MIALIKTVNPATINFAQAILKDADIPCFLFDQHQSLIEGSIGIIPRRIMVLAEDEADARDALIAAGLGDELD